MEWWNSGIMERKWMTYCFEHSDITIFQITTHYSEKPYCYYYCEYTNIIVFVSILSIFLNNAISKIFACPVRKNDCTGVALCDLFVLLCDWFFKWLLHKGSQRRLRVSQSEYALLKQSNKIYNYDYRWYSDKFFSL